MKKTGILKDIRFINHKTGPGHPESPRRLEVIYAMLEEPDMKDKFPEVPARRAAEEELSLIHTPGYIKMVAATEGREWSSLDPDTSTSAGSYEAALLAAGGLCQAISMVMAGELDNAMALLRPPGHHAESDRGMGFCLFNNVAVAARYAQKFHNLKRVLIADWDLHHGNGTQHSFEDDPTVLYFSTHQYPYYPGTGAFDEAGLGRGEGFTVNVPLRTGCGDTEFVGIFEKILRPIALEFKPELILVSAGFDIHEDDPLGGMRVTPKGFAGLTASIMDIAEQCCGGKVVITLEGGYDLNGLRSSVKEVLRQLAGLSETDHAAMAANADQTVLGNLIKRVSQVHSRYWKGLNP
ncbi:Histone deacetylase family protein [uncultured Desulfobacterium sp.]|uniref:Histone deacetylase family protein n=1 Tax=uncultured Desulfobacterium sp. TaxID=201089 RepID=A0A445MZ61_9BACT|nr:Histone deacetylase family protein [uncultured Desulfobacterium sp.]